MPLEESGNNSDSVWEDPQFYNMTNVNASLPGIIKWQEIALHSFVERQINIDKYMGKKDQRGPLEFICQFEEKCEDIFVNQAMTAKYLKMCPDKKACP